MLRCRGELSTTVTIRNGLWPRRINDRQSPTPRYSRRCNVRGDGCASKNSDTLLDGTKVPLSMLEAAALPGSHAANDPICEALIASRVPWFKVLCFLTLRHSTFQALDLSGTRLLWPHSSIEIESLYSSRCDLVGVRSRPRPMKRYTTRSKA
jgi:hypothetical protein